MDATGRLGEAGDATRRRLATAVRAVQDSVALELAVGYVLALVGLYVAGPVLGVLDPAGTVLGTVGYDQVLFAALSWGPFVLGLVLGLRGEVRTSPVVGVAPVVAFYCLLAVGDLAGGSTSGDLPAWMLAVAIGTTGLLMAVVGATVGYAGRHAIDSVRDGDAT